MRSRFWVAYGALALAFALLVPTLAPLSGSMDSFAHDLANGAFRPFGSGRSPQQGFSESLGGFTGHSTGGYVPGAGEVPTSWLMDRDGTGGQVVIDTVFNPSLGAMKRLKAYDQVADDGSTLGVADKRFRPYAADPTHVRYDTPIEGRFAVKLAAGEPVPIFSPHPRAAIRTWALDPPLPAGRNLSFLQDGADTLHVLSPVDITATLTIGFMSEARYYLADVPEGMRVADYAPVVRPDISPALREDAGVVLARAGVAEGSDLATILEALNAYFRSFTEGEIPPPSEVDSLYLALALGGHGCCRHRAFAYMVTAQAVGIPTRVVVNEAHAFVEVMLPDGSWRQFNLGGCGTYTIRNPEGHRELFAQASDPREEANPDEDRPLPVVVTFTNITESPERIVKGEQYVVSGTVQSAGGRAVPGARIDVFLNETKETPGRLTGAGTTNARGEFSIVSRVPRDLPARQYQLVARALDSGGGNVRYEESWSDPPVDVFAPTKFLFPDLVAAVGFPADITGRVVDLDGSPVPHANVTWSIDGVGQPPLRADETGRFSARITFDEVGTRALGFRFPGSEHHGAATASVEVDVEEGAILLPPEAPTLARAETGLLHGSIAVAGAALGEREVRATMLAGNQSTRVLASGGGTTGDGGAFSVALEIPASLAPGVYPVRYEVPALRLESVGLARVAIRPTLLVEAPHAVSAGDAWELRATLVSDNGTRIAGGIVEVTLDGNASTTRALLTNSTGVARFEFPARALETGQHAVLVSFPGDAAHAEASESARLEVVRPWYATVPPWAYAALAASVLAILAIGRILRPGGRARQLLAGAGAKRLARWQIEAEFPDHPEGVPAVFEPGEEVRVTLRVRRREDGANVPARLAVEGPAGRMRGRAAGTGWTLRVQAPRAMTMALHVRARGLARLWTAPLHLAVPVQPYRRAVEDGFVALRRRARLGESASPGDLVRTLGPRLGSAQQQKLREAAALFEAADYSERPVDRAFYHAFALARRDLERALPAPSGGAAAEPASAGARGGEG